MVTIGDPGRPERDAPALPEWARPPATPTPHGASPVGVLLRAGIGLLIAAALWVLGHRTPAVVLAVVMVLMAAASLLAPSVATALDRATAWVQTVAGRVLSFVLLTAVELLFFAPLALVLRLVRHDPMALGSSPTDPSFWRDSPSLGRKPLYSRQFAYEAGRHERAAHAGLFPLLRVRAAIGLLVLVVLLDLGVGAAVNGMRRATRSGANEARSGLVAPDLAAGAKEPWLQDLVDELDRSYDERDFHPFRAWAQADFDGEYLSIEDGVRQSYQAPGVGSGDAIEVAMFGGSAMLGWYQRDSHTIPSELARLAEADGIPVRFVNRGHPAYQNWQEVLLLEELVSAGSVPDLAVFYDGVNELVSQFNHGPFTEPSHVNARYTEELLEAAVERGRPSLSGVARDYWTRTSALWRLAKGAVSLVTEGDAKLGYFKSPWEDQTVLQAERGRAAADIYERGVDLAQRLADSYGFESTFFWQPSVYTKDVMGGEEDAVGSFGTLPEAWRRATEVARRFLPDSVVDLSEGLDGVEEPVMYDFVHTNEAGAKAMAQVIYRRLRPTLVELAEERR